MKIFFTVTLTILMACQSSKIPAKVDPHKFTITRDEQIRFDGPLQLAPNEQELNIVFTNHLWGQIDTCGCEMDPTGGLLQRGNFLKRLKASGVKNIFLADAGDMFGEYKLKKSDSKKIEKLLKAQIDMGYEALALDSSDLKVGALKWIQKNKFAQKLPWVGLNLDKATEKLETPFLSVLKDDLGFLVTSFRDYTNTNQDIDPTRVDTAARINQALTSQGLPFVLILSDLSYPEKVKLASKLQKSAIFIGSSREGMIAAAIVKEGALFASGPGYLQQYGQLRAKINPKVQSFVFNYRVERLGQRYNQL